MITDKNDEEARRCILPSNST